MSCDKLFPSEWKFFDTEVSFKNSRDKTIEDESIKIKKLFVFGKELWLFLILK